MPHKASIHSLPNELLAAIFHSARGERCQRGGKYEILVSHVSRHWRYVALSTTTLWSSIMIKGHLKNSWLQAYLDRSQGSPLDLRLDFWQLDSYWQPLQEEVLAIVGRFVPHAPRFRNVNIKTYREETMSSILATFRNLEMPMLRKLSVLLEEELGDCENVPSFNGEQIMCGKPFNLQALHVDAVHCQWIPLSSIRELHLYGAWGGSSKLSLTEFINVLKAPKELITLVVEGNLIDAPLWPPVDPLPAIELPHLRSLRISSPLHFIHELLFCVTAPLLESAWLDFVPNNSLQHWTSARERPYPSLRHLGFHTTSSCDQVDSHLLSGVSGAFPNVTFLSVVCFGKRCPVLEYTLALDTLSRMSGALPLFPTLETVAIRGASGEHIQPAASSEAMIEIILDLARGRIEKGRPLKKVLIESSWVTPQRLSRLEEVVDVGIFDVSTFVEPLCAAGFVPC